MWDEVRRIGVIRCHWPDGNNLRGGETERRSVF
jgi:hypothetical protein